MNEPTPLIRPAPKCAGLSIAIPLLGMLLTFFLVSLPALKGGGDFASFAPAIVTILAGFPLGIFGLVLAIAAIVRKESCIVVAIAGIVLNLVVLLVSSPLILAWLESQK
jgi:hypothetical protein